MTADLPAAPLPVGVKLSWGVGQLVPYTIFAVVSAQLLVYLTDQVGIAPVVAGLILAGAKLYDAFSDVAIGLLSDRTATRWGRRRPWMATGSVALAVSLVAMFHVDTVAPHLRVAAATLAVLVFFTGVSLFTIPHMAMAAEMSDDYHERTSIQFYGAVFGVVASLIGTSLAPLFMAGAGPGAAGHHRMALMLLPVPLVAGLLCVLGTARAPRPVPAPAARPSVGQWIAGFVGNRPLCALLATKALHLVATSSLLTTILYYCIHVIGVGQRGIVIFGIITSIGGVTGLMITARFLMRTRPKHQLYGMMLIGMAISVFGYLAVPRGNLWLFALPPLCTSLFGAAGLMFANSMVADIVERDHLVHGTHRAGAITAIVSTVHKAAPALAALIVGAALSYGGYRAASAVQTAEAIRMVRICVAILPGIALALASLPMLLIYDLDEQALERQRRSSADAAEPQP